MDTSSNTTGDELPDIAALSGDDVLRVMGSSAAGLTNERAAELQGRFGKNLIQAGAKKSPIIAFLSNFTHLMAILLWVAGFIALIAGMPELCVAVWLVNLINGCFSFWQEHQADKATEALKKMLPSYVNVIRDGVISEKRHLALPEKLVNVIRCRNPRCITTIEQELPHIFKLTGGKKRVYRCIYCESRA